MRLAPAAIVDGVTLTDARNRPDLRLSNARYRGSPRRAMRLGSRAVA
jgi:hypothetical protein